MQPNVASEEVLVKIHKHLRYVFVLIGPGARATRNRIDRAQEEIERCLERRPMLLEGESPSKPAFEHLLETHALAGEHLGPGKRPGGYGAPSARPSRRPTASWAGSEPPGYPLLRNCSSSSRSGSAPVAP